MLILHGGMPKTGTTDLQARLAVHASALRTKGIVYPRRWRCEENIAHHGLCLDLMAGGERRQRGEADLLAYLENEDDQTVIVSSEGITSLLANEPEMVVDLLQRVQRIRPVRLVLTLRAFDEFLESQFLHKLKHREAVERDAEKFFDGCEPRAMRLYSGIARAKRDLGEAAVVLLAYAKSPAYGQALESSLGLSEPLPPHDLGQYFRNRKLSLKSQAALANLDVINQRLDCDIDRKRLIAGFYMGELSFEGDRRQYRVMPYRTAKHYHDYALETARNCGLEEYVSFFADRDLEPYDHESIDLAVLQADDLDAIEAWWQSLGKDERKAEHRYGGSG